MLWLGCVTEQEHQLQSIRPRALTCSYLWSQTDPLLSYFRHCQRSAKCYVPGARHSRSTRGPASFLLYSQSHFSGHPPVQLSVHHCCYPSYSVSSATVVFHLLLEDWSIQYRGKNGVRASTLLFFSTHFLQNIHTIKMAQIPVLSSVAGSNWAQVSHRYLMEKKKIMSHLKLLWSGMRLVSPYSSCLQYSCFHLS